jgi:hypothetical protein
MSSTRSDALDDRSARKAAFRAARRKRAMTLLPGTAIILWSLADLVAARHARLAAAKAGLIHQAFDHVQPIVWTLLVVLVPYLVSVKPKPKRSGALLAMFTGPVLTPLLFGAGGWRLWQILAFAGLVLWIESGDQKRARRAVQERDRRRLVVDLTDGAAPPDVAFVDDDGGAASSFHAMSGASFQRRSSS